MRKCSKIQRCVSWILVDQGNTGLSPSDANAQASIRFIQVSSE